MTEDQKIFMRFNANPWKKILDDCAIRALSFGIKMDYAAICKKLGERFRKGYGLIGKDGVDLEVIKSKFDDFFDVVEDITDNDYFNRPPEFDDLPYDPIFDDPDINTFNITLTEFIEYYSGPGRFIVGLMPNPNAKRASCRKQGGHVTYVNCLNKKYFVDTWNCSEMLVDAYMRIKKTVDVKDPLFNKLFLKK